MKKLASEIKDHDHSFYLQIIAHCTHIGVMIFGDEAVWDACQSKPNSHLEKEIFGDGPILWNNGVLHLVREFLERVDPERFWNYIKGRNLDCLKSPAIDSELATYLIKRAWALPKHELVRLFPAKNFVYGAEDALTCLLIPYLLNMPQEEASELFKYGLDPLWKDTFWPSVCEKRVRDLFAKDGLHAAPGIIGMVRAFASNEIEDNEEDILSILQAEAFNL